MRLSSRLSDKSKNSGEIESFIVFMMRSRNLTAQCSKIRDFQKRNRKRSIGIGMYMVERIVNIQELIF